MLRDVLLRDLFVGRWHSLRPWPRVAIYTLGILLLLGVMKTSTFSVVVPHLTEDGHAILSLNVAVNRSFCGVPSGISPQESGKALFRDPAASTQPVRDFIAARWGSLERYCATVTRPFMNNENSLMLIESWAWRVAPDLSLEGIGRVLLALRLALLLFFCVVFLRLGAGVVLCYVILDAAFALLARLHEHYGFSGYSFLVPMVLATIALYPLMLSLPSGSRARQMIWPAIAGVWSAFMVNMRTSYLPLCAALAFIYLCASMFGPTDGGRPPHRLRHVSVAVLLLVLGYSSFQYSFIVKSRSSGSESLSYHTFFHPLVLSIGLPTNSFSEREGIEWDDGVGLTLAHRVNPSAGYLTKEYEQALGTYYFRLWRRYPREMTQVYLNKAKLAAMEMMDLTDVPDAAVMFARRVLRLAPNGLWLLLLLVGFGAAATWQYFRRPTPVLMLMVLIGVSGTLLMLESMLIVPRYFLTYHAPLLLLYCSVIFVLIQVVVARVLDRMRLEAPVHTAT